VIESIPDSKEHGALIFRGQAVQKELLGQCHIPEDLTTPLTKNSPQYKNSGHEEMSNTTVDIQFQEPPVAAAVTTNITNSTTDTLTEHDSWYRNTIADLKKLLALFGNIELRKRLLICYFAWCVTEMTYYALALNADNFTADR
jgi:hypothetical protein